MLAFDRHDGGAEGTAVLLHSLALDRTIWGGLLPHLLPRFEVIAVDLPNHGASPVLEEASIPAMGDAVAELIRAEADDPVILVGLSLGGCVAQAVAAQHPQIVRGLGLLDTTAWYGETAMEAWESRAQKAMQDGLGSLAGFQLERWFTAGFKERHPDVGERLLDIFRANDLDAYVATCRAMGSADLREAVDGLAVPTCIVVGTEDGATPPSHSFDLWERIAEASLHVLPSCSHLSAIERSDTIGQLLELDLFPRLA